MQRFVRIAEIPWAEGSSLTREISPYSAYMESPSVKPKITGFSRYHFDGMELKFLINGAPSQYGLALVSYRPLPGFSGGFVDQTAGSTAYFMGHTCYPHVYLGVAASAGATMTLPFCNPKNCISVDDVASLGTLYVDSFGPLRTVGEASGPITISVYARPVNFSMWGPTTYTPQSDEYSAQPISTMASTVAYVAGMFSSVPAIRPYMLATQMAAGATASIARLFGYSNPPVIDPVHVLSNRPTYGICSPEIPIQMDKLTLDPKNELCVDPRTVGAPAEDAMEMSYMMNREVLVGETVWYSSDLPDAALVSLFVTPEMYVNDNVSSLYGPLAVEYGASKVQLTPSCHLAQMFQYWRGPIHFSFTVIASQFHRGRYVIEYDPAGSTSADGQGLLRQWVVDIKDSPTFNLSIDMCSDTAWLPTTHSAFKTGNSYIVPRSLTPSVGLVHPLRPNGCLRVRVLNDLASTATTTDITMLVRMNCKDIEFAAPTDIPMWPTTFVPQSAVLAEGTMEVTEADTSVETMWDPNDSMIFQGEIVKSVRTLLQRANHFQTLRIYPSEPLGQSSGIKKGYSYDLASSGWNRMMLKWVFPRFGFQVGSQPADLLYAWDRTNLGGNATKPFVHGKPTAISYLSPCYMGNRGSIAYRATIDGNNNDSEVGINALTMGRCKVPMDVMGTREQITGTAYGHRSGQRNSFIENSVSGMSGISVTNDVKYLDAVVPDYSRYRMHPGLPAAQYQETVSSTGTPPFLDPLGNMDNVELNASLFNTASGVPSNDAWNSSPDLFVYQQAGVDYTLLFYLAPPTYYTYSQGVS